MHSEPTPSVCPRCGSTGRQVRAGCNPSGSRRWVCQACGFRYTPNPLPNGYPEELRRQVVRMCLEGQSFRSVARELSISPQTVVNWINAYIRSTSRAIYRLPKK
jgi:transposase-like protein